MRIFLLVSLTGLPLFLFGQKKSVCFTIDDLPLVTYGITDSVYQKNLMASLVDGLVKNKIPAIGFVNETKLYHEDKLVSFRVQLLQHWADNGLALGNHTFSHPDYNTRSLKSFGEDVVKGEKTTKEILHQKGKTMEYFRHPFLHTGSTKVKHDSLTNFLETRGYTVAPVTIDDDDYLFALAYKRAQDKNDLSLMKQIGADYIAYMEKKVLHFEKQAQGIFGRDISQILLIHANQLNADYMPELAKVFLRNNYVFISLEKALEDEAYTTPITVFGTWGISWLDRWALSQGKKGDFFKNDPPTPEYIQNLAR